LRRGNPEKTWMWGEGGKVVRKLHKCFSAYPTGVLLYFCPVGSKQRAVGVIFWAAVPTRMKERRLISCGAGATFLQREKKKTVWEGLFWWVEVAERTSPFPFSGITGPPMAGTGAGSLPVRGRRKRVPKKMGFFYGEFFQGEKWGLYFEGRKEKRASAEPRMKSRRRGDGPFGGPKNGFVEQVSLCMRVPAAVGA